MASNAHRKQTVTCLKCLPPFPFKLNDNQKESSHTDVTQIEINKCHINCLKILIFSLQTASFSQSTQFFATYFQFRAVQSLSLYNYFPRSKVRRIFRTVNHVLAAYPATDTPFKKQHRRSLHALCSRILPSQTAENFSHFIPHDFFSQCSSNNISNILICIYLSPYFMERYAHKFSITHTGNQIE